jgi:hypothetical protein
MIGHVARSARALAEFGGGVARTQVGDKPRTGRNAEPRRAAGANASGKAGLLSRPRLPHGFPGENPHLKWNFPGARKIPQDRLY